MIEKVACCLKQAKSCKIKQKYGTTSMDWSTFDLSLFYPGQPWLDYKFWSIWYLESDAYAFNRSFSA